MPSPPAVGGGFNLRSGIGAMIINNTVNITQNNLPTVNLLITDGTHGQVYGNFLRNTAGVIANGVTLEVGSSFWYERNNDGINVTTAVTDNGGVSNNTSLQPLFAGAIITPKTTTAPTDGGNTNVGCGTTLFIHGSAIATHTVTLPTSPRVGCTITLSTRFAITALTMTAAQTIVAPLTTLINTAPGAWTFAAGAWYRCAACQ
jgi:hypothetical protein